MSEDAHDTSGYGPDHPGWGRLIKNLDLPPDSILNAYRFGLEATHGVVLPARVRGLTKDENEQVNRLLGMDGEE